ncbi:unnamed protein product [Euphydryas editha]|uniref:Reverse transcriptase domain-containing protein n=1 Tax=Euphydryas editha TaxID=104508 RepID=A0AAU9TYY1_EUPED|nr:unnamed protein product [Euphydryas editha]
MANPPTERGKPPPTKKKNKKRKKRAARPARSEPAAASTPQPKQPEEKEPRRTQGVTEKPITQPAQSDITDIVRTFIEALTAILIAYTQGGLRGHIRQLTLLAQSQNIHIILLGETKLSEEVELRIPNYIAYRRDEISPRGYAYRGTAALVRRDIVHEELPHAQFVSLRTQGVRVHSGDDELLIYAAYKPPKLAFNSNDIETLLNAQLPTLIIGDLNAKHPAWGSRLISPSGEKLLEDSESRGYVVMGPGAPTNIPTKPNEQPDVLDIVLAYKMKHPLDAEVLYELDTQHLPILVTVNLRHSHLIQRPPTSKVDWNKFITIAARLQLSISIETPADVDTATEMITQAIQRAKDAATTQCTQSRQKDPLPYALREKIKRKSKLRKLWTRSRCPRVKTELNRIAEEISRALAALDNDFWEDAVDRAAEDDTALYRLCKKMTGIDTPIYPLKDIDGKRRYAARDRAEILAEHLERQFTPNPPNMTNTNVVDHHKEIRSIIQAFNTTQFSQLRCEDMITPLELRKTIQRLPKRKAPGKDGITNATLTKLPKNCIQAIITLYNGILQTGHFPEAWKQGRVIVIPKPGKDKRLPSSYRPITLLSHVAKLFERLLLRRLVPHLPLREEQFGFRSDHSTTLQLARVINHLASEHNNKRCTVGVFLDMEKAFDRVWHEGLLAKLIRTTTPPALIKIIASFLKGLITVIL